MAVDEMVIKWSMDSKNFNDGLTNMNKSMNLLKSEFNATSSKLKSFGSETDQLKNKQEYLTKSMEVQKSKIDTLKNAYDKQVQATGANSTASQNLAIKLNNQIGYYNKLEGELKQTNTELDKQAIKVNKLNDTLNNAGSRLSTFGSKVNELGNKLTFGVTMPLAGAGIAAFTLASDMSESMNKVDVAFGDNADSIKEWSKNTLNEFGIAKGSALDAAALFGDMGTGMGLTTSEAAGMSKKLVGLSGDLSSFKNVQLDVAKTALAGIFTGETESLKQLGIVMTQANLEEYAHSQGIKKKIQDMTQAEQVQLRYNYVLEKTKNAQGDFARTSDGAANQQRIFKESLKELGATFGENLLPVLTPFIAKANDLLKTFGQLDKDTQKNIVTFGMYAIAAGPVIKVFGGITGAIGGTLKFVSNLDKNFKILKDTCTGAASNISKVGTAMANGAKAAGTLALNIGKTVIQFGKQAISSAASTVKLIAQKTATLAATIATNALKIAQAALNFVMSLNPLTLIIAGLIALAATFVILYNKCEWFRNGVNAVWGFIKNVFSDFSNYLDSVFATDWTNTFGVFGNIINAFLANTSNTWDSIKKIFGGVIDFVAGVFSGDWARAWEGVKNIFGGIMEGLGAVFKSPLNIVIGLINMAIDGLNSISIDIPKFVPGVGGKHFGVNLPKMNYLYEGGIIDRPTFLNGNTVVGDSYKGVGRQAEAVIPLGQMYSNIRSIVNEESNSQPIYVVVNVDNNMDSKAIARTVTTTVKKEITRDTTNYSIGKGRIGYA